MIDRLRSVLFAPASAFAADEEPSLLAPLLVVVAYGAVALVTITPILVAVAEVLPVSAPVSVAVGTEQVSAPGIPVAIVALGIPALVFVWAVVALVTFGGARVLGGDGDLRETVSFVGWGFLPKLLGAIALGIVVFVVALVDPDATFVEVLVGSRDSVEVGVLSVSGPGGTILPVVVAIEVIASVWMTYVWYGGLRGAQALSRWRAVGLAVVLFILFNSV